MTAFNYKTAFSRNLGWVTEDESIVLASKKVAIAGMGGVGGHYAEVLSRLGISKFHIADFDEFEVQNFNRQNCSGMSTLNHKKVEVIKNKILDINPNAEIKIFEKGVDESNVQDFLENVDVYLDGLDFFVLDIRKLVFKEAHVKKIPALTIAPVGMGASLVCFDSQSMSFEQHFGFKANESLEDSAVRFVVGLTPTLKQVKYLVDRSRSNFKEKKAPSLPMGPYLCAGVAGSEVLKIFLQRGSRLTSPHVLHFDAYLQTYHKTKIWFGSKNLIQKIKFYIIKNMLKEKK